MYIYTYLYYILDWTSVSLLYYMFCMSSSWILESCGWTLTPHMHRVALLWHFFCEIHKNLKSSCTFLLSPPNSGDPHVTTSPSARIAVKAPFCVASNRNTLQLRSGGDRSSPPQVTMDPSAFTAPKVCSLAQSCFTLVNICWTASLLPPLVGSPQVTTLTPVTAAKALIVPWISSTFRSKGSISLPGWWTNVFR